MGKAERKQFGEVMTPISLVENMLDTLPEDVWSNSNFKWLDSCVGTGMFQSVIIKKLMEGLIDFEKDEKKRYKHIVENQIYVVELQSKHILVFKNIFNENNEYNLNIYEGDYLDSEFDKYMKEDWDVKKFDIIIGNPPYNENSNKGYAQTKPLWDKFVIKNISLLIENGYLCLVHPGAWRIPKGIFKPVQNLIKQRQILYLEIHNVTDGFKMFEAYIAYDFYCLKNVLSNDHIATIKFQDGTIVQKNISNTDFIPNAMFSELEKIIAKHGEEKVNLLHSYSAYQTHRPHMNKMRDETFVYPIINTITKNGEIINLRWSSKNDRGHFGVPKLIWSIGSATSPIVDLNGQYGLTEWAYAIEDKIDNLEQIKKAMISVPFKKLMSATDGGRHRYNWKVISMLRKDFWKEFV